MNFRKKQKRILKKLKIKRKVAIQMPNVRPPYPNELYHYGVKGMHWGVRRYQPYPKGYSGSGKYLGKRSRVGMFGKKAKVRKLSDEEKESLIRLGTVNELLKYSDQLSTEERNRAAARVESQRRLKALRYSGALKTYNDVTTAVGNTSKILKTGLEIKKLGSESGKKAPKDYSYDSMSTYYNNAPRNGTGADWSGIYGYSDKKRKFSKRKRRR
jgi:hypothetical protein